MGAVVIGAIVIVATAGEPEGALVATAGGGPEEGMELTISVGGPLGTLLGGVLGALLGATYSLKTQAFGRAEELKQILVVGLKGFRPRLPKTCSKGRRIAMLQ